MAWSLIWITSVFAFSIALFNFAQLNNCTKTEPLTLTLAVTDHPMSYS